VATDVLTAKLRSMLNVSEGEGCTCFLSNEILSDLIARYLCLELAAYHACILMAQRTDMKMSDGTTIPDQSGYWLRRAMEFRPYSGRQLRRADEVKP